MNKADKKKLLNKLRKEVNKYELPGLAVDADVPYVTLYKFATGRVSTPRKPAMEKLVKYFQGGKK